MPQQNTEQELIPGWHIRLNGSDPADEILPNVLAVEVEQHVNGSDMFDIAVNIWDVETQDFQFLDDSTFQIGSALEVLMGYGEDMHSVLLGEIVALEIDYGAENTPLLHVVGYDKLHRFRRGRVTNTFSNIKDSEIAEQIAGEMQLQSEVEDSEIVYTHLFQYNQSNIDFLQERARRINYEVDVVEDTLFFRKAAFAESETLSLDYRDDVKSLSLRLSTQSQIKKVVVKGWDITAKEAIVGLGQVGDESGVMGGADLGVDVADGAFGEAEEVIVDNLVFEQAEADQMAKAIFNRMNLQYIKADGEAIGNALIRAGEVIALGKLGELMSGLYYLVKVRHMIDEEGFVTHFSCRRNATS